MVWLWWNEVDQKGEIMVERSIDELDSSYYTELAIIHFGNVRNFRGVKMTGKSWINWHCGRRMVKVVGIFQSALTRRKRTWSSKPLLFCTHPECGFYENTNNRGTHL